MSKKKSPRLIIGAFLLAGVAVAGIGTMLYHKPAQTVAARQDTGTAMQQVQVQAQAQAQALHGQVIFDTTQGSLPPQSSLTVQLVASNIADNEQKLARQVVIPVGEVSSPVDFTLPAVELDDTRTYVLKARISVGDTLLYADESAMPVDISHSAYRIHLAQVASSENIQTADKNQITGQIWLAEDLMSAGIIDNSHMTLQIAEVTPVADEAATKSYRATGSGGCNRYNASLILDEQSQVIKFDHSIPTTMMSCAEALLIQEGKFIDMLTKASSYKFSEHGMLYLLDDNQNPIGRFTLAEND
ncbi:MAG: Hypothetical protein BHV28_08840 [Candidatus Tokpelaia hoelldobleri]|uniref:DUF306 domain-containing protein n=1 Tax=Candidatus Tokpelaia hoelldobleri TaxID=1902579 RepID=A0A1U9JUQ3_9HYPH|nr:MAG: Hypothetical protein BHV28_08840 [Candidatus Tokpelaia hoelldoblerii]